MEFCETGLKHWSGVWRNPAILAEIRRRQPNGKPIFSVHVANDVVGRCATIATRRVSTLRCDARVLSAVAPSQGGVLKGVLGRYEWGLGVPEGIWAVNCSKLVRILCIFGQNENSTEGASC